MILADLRVNEWKLRNFSKINATFFWEHPWSLHVSERVKMNKTMVLIVVEIDRLVGEEDI